MQVERQKENNGIAHCRLPQRNLILSESFSKRSVELKFYLDKYKM